MIPRDVAPTRFRDVLGTFATGVVVVTALDGDQPVGMTVQSFSSLSLRPPLVLFCPARTSRTWPRVRRVGSFCANVLAADQADLAATMAAGRGDRFRDVAWEAGVTGAPRLAGALSHVEATVQAVHDGGDHDVVVGRVRAVARGAEGTRPLLFHEGRYARLLAEESAEAR
ncbi:flavin reductase family protein [Nocardioides zeae]|uniref:Flavin reductase family protein n=1 Tax=Nocardioides imazamoxiresistens TaxID=3231893 RepID=A0ABU3PTD2_9ACTN|nr:flavin reductase family protein [Nocardioides zeae]MDT9592459.1 flavin reductase family protein [Nocardioides zeae]